MDKSTPRLATMLSRLAHGVWSALCAPDVAWLDRTETPHWIHHVRRRSARKPRPEGWLLAHSAKYLRSGLEHFYIDPDTNWKRCRCGWRDDLGPHYAHPDVACRNASLLDLMDKIY